MPPNIRRAIGEAWLWPADQAAQEQAWRRLRELLPPRVPVGVWGVEARAAEVAGGLVLNLCNYRREPVLVQVPGAWRDALTGEAVTGAVTLPPNGVRLWRR